jgi:hypothetical protein
MYRKVDRPRRSNMSDTDGLSDAGQQTFPLEYVKELRNENASMRVRAKEAEAKMAAYDPEALTKANAQIRELKVGQALTETALKLGANPRLTRATLQMDGHLTGLDPDQADFLPALDALVQTAIDNEPSLKGSVKPTIPTKMGSDISHPGTGRPLGQPISREQIQAARNAGNHEQIADWVKTGQLEAVFRGMA